MTNKAKRISKSILKVMRDNRLNQSQLAGMIGVGSWSIGSWIKGTREPTSHNLKRLYSLHLLDDSSGLDNLLDKMGLHQLIDLNFKVGRKIKERGDK